MSIDQKDEEIKRTLEVTAKDPSELKYAEVIDYFTQYGPILRAKVEFDEKTNKWSGKLFILSDLSTVDEIIKIPKNVINEKEIIVSKCSRAWPSPELNRLYRTVEVKTKNEVTSKLMYTDIIDHFIQYGPIEDFIIQFNSTKKWDGLLDIVFQSEEIVSDVLKTPVRTLKEQKVIVYQRVDLDRFNRTLEVTAKEPFELKYTEVSDYFAKHGPIDDILKPDRKNEPFIVVYKCREPVDELIKTPTLFINGNEVSVKKSYTASRMFRLLPGLE